MSGDSFKSFIDTVVVARDGVPKNLLAKLTAEAPTNALAQP